MLTQMVFKAILAHVFACMGLMRSFIWFENIAERQIPRIHALLPDAWKGAVEWPLAVASGDERPLTS